MKLFRNIIISLILVAASILNAATMILFPLPTAVVAADYHPSDENGSLTVSDCCFINPPINESTSAGLRLAPGLTLQAPSGTQQISHSPSLLTVPPYEGNGTGQRYVHRTNHPEPQCVLLYLVHRRFNV